MEADLARMAFRPTSKAIVETGSRLTSQPIRTVDAVISSPVAHAGRMLTMTNDLVREARRMIQRAPICEPGPGEFVDECHWSKTGWAIWVGAKAEHGNFCTCRPALDPVSSTGEPS
jgi:hypothetical protein